MSSPDDPMRRAAGVLRGAARAYVHLAEGTVRLYVRQLRWTERVAMQALHSRLDAAAADRRAGELVRAAREDSQNADPASAMAALLAQSLEQSAQNGRATLYARMVSAIVPDEARILAALSDGSGAAVVHVDARSLSGRGRRLIENASSVGRTAALSVPGLTSTYVTNLLAMGLVVLGAEDRTLEFEYETLTAERAVREALREGELAKVPARVVRQTLRLSPLGLELWQASNPDTSAGT